MWTAWGLGNEGNAPGLICFVLRSWTGYLTYLPRIPMKCLSSVFPSHYHDASACQRFPCRVAASLHFPKALAPSWTHSYCGTCVVCMLFPHSQAFCVPRMWIYPRTFLGKVGKSLTVYYLDLYHTTADEVLLYHLCMFLSYWHCKILFTFISK